MAKFPIEHPTPKATPEEPRLFAWPVQRTLACPSLIEPRPRNFADVLTTRRSDRTMDRASLRDVVNVVAYATLARAFRSDDPNLTRRPSPSAGAIHPIEIVIVHGGRTARTFCYDAREHKLNSLQIVAPEKLHLFSNELADVMPAARGSALVMLGESARVAARYHDPLSLLWRDAGALLQTLALAATAFEMSFCPLGILGHEVPSAIGATDHLTALGVALIGRQASG